VLPLLQWESNESYISEYLFVASGMQHAKRMRRVVLSSMICLVVPYFSTLSHKSRDLKKKCY